MAEKSVSFSVILSGDLIHKTKVILKCSHTNKKGVFSLMTLNTPDKKETLKLLRNYFDLDVIEEDAVFAGTHSNKVIIITQEFNLRLRGGSGDSE